MSTSDRPGPADLRWFAPASAAAIAAASMAPAPGVDEGVAPTLPSAALSASALTTEGGTAVPASGSGPLAGAAGVSGTAAVLTAGVSVWGWARAELAASCAARTACALAATGPPLGSRAASPAPPAPSICMSSACSFADSGDSPLSAALTSAVSLSSSTFPLGSCDQKNMLRLASSGNLMTKHPGFGMNFICASCGKMMKSSSGLKGMPSARGPHIRWVSPSVALQIRSFPLRSSGFMVLFSTMMRPHWTSMRTAGF